MNETSHLSPYDQMKQTKKEEIYWEEYSKLLKMMDSKTIMQYIRTKDSEVSWLKEINN